MRSISLIIIGQWRWSIIRCCPRRWWIWRWRAVSCQCHHCSGVFIVLSWYPSANIKKLPFNLVVWPTEPFLRLVRGSVPPAFGVDITPVVWLGSRDCWRWRWRMGFKHHLGIWWGYYFGVCKQQCSLLLRKCCMWDSWEQTNKRTGLSSSNCFIHEFKLFYPCLIQMKYKRTRAWMNLQQLSIGCLGQVWYGAEHL